METSTHVGFHLREAVAEEVRALLGRRRLTGAKLAAAIDRSEMYVSRRLRGETSFDLDDLERIADVLKVSIIDLLPMAAKQTGDRKTTEWYASLSERRSERARRPPDNRPSGKPRSGNASGVPRTAYLKRTDARKAA